MCHLAAGHAKVPNIAGPKLVEMSVATVFRRAPLSRFPRIRFTHPFSMRSHALLANRYLGDGADLRPESYQPVTIIAFLNRATNHRLMVDRP